MSARPRLADVPRTVLVVDDAAAMRQDVRGLVDAADGWEMVGEARDGQEAVEMAAALHPQVIVLDQGMPRLQGLEALPHLRSSCPDAHIVMWSTDDRLEAAALENGADGFVNKSRPLRDLFSAMQGTA
ncbi:MAG TPA: response regulator transcription factor [Mycobacteriales bacterium]|nr:response regulator transcription factor [Mycobacteriales bacterium]